MYMINKNALLGLALVAALAGACTKWDQGPVSSGGAPGQPVVIYDPGLTKLNLIPDKNIGAVINFKLTKYRSLETRGTEVLPFGKVAFLVKPVNYDPRVIIHDYSNEAAKKIYPDSYKTPAATGKLTAKKKYEEKKAQVIAPAPSDIEYADNYKRLNLKFIFDPAVGQDFSRYAYSNAFSIPVQYEFRLGSDKILSLDSESYSYEEEFFLNKLSNFTRVIPIEAVADQTDSNLGEDGKVNKTTKRITGAFKAAEAAEGFKVPPQFFVSAEPQEYDVTDPEAMDDAITIDPKEGLKLKWYCVNGDCKDEDVTQGDTFMDIRIVPHHASYNPKDRRSQTGMLDWSRSVLVNAVDNGSYTIPLKSIQDAFGKGIQFDSKHPVQADIFMYRVKPSKFVLSKEGEAKDSDPIGVVLCSIGSAGQHTLNVKAEETSK